MAKPNERPGWLKTIKNPYPGFPDPAYNPYSKKDWLRIGKFYGWEEALDAVLKAADEHGIVFVEKRKSKEYCVLWRNCKDVNGPNCNKDCCSYAPVSWDNHQNYVALSLKIGKLIDAVEKLVGDKQC